jgi:hypothetical protein
MDLARVENDRQQQIAEAQRAAAEQAAAQQAAAEQAAAAARAEAAQRAAEQQVRPPEDVVETAPPPSVFDEAPRLDAARPLEAVRLTTTEQQMLDRSGATTLLTEDAGDARTNCLDRAVDTVRGLSPAERQSAELVMLEDTRPGSEAATGHVVVRQGDDVLDPSSGNRYASTDDFLKANPQYREAGTLAADKATAIFDTAAGSPARARALDDAGVPAAMKNMFLADNDAGGGGGDGSLAMQVKLYGPDVLPDRAGSEAAGRADGESLRRAMEEYDLVAPSGGSDMGMQGMIQERKQKLLDELAKLEDHAGDPAYAAALLEKVGADKVRALLETYPIPFGADADDPNAMSSVSMQQMQEELSPLGDAFYAADKSGMLSPEVRNQVLELSPNSLSVFLRLGPQDPAFFRDAAKAIMDEPSSRSRSSAMHNMLLAYPTPQTLLELVADKKYAKELLSFDPLAMSRDYGKDLAFQLGAALKAEPPGSPQHQAAMTNIIDLAQSSSTRDLISDQPELATTLAENFTPYLEHAAWLQGRDISHNTYQDKIAIPPHDGPVLPPDVTADDVANFFGGLVGAKPARDVLQAEATRLVQDGHLAEMFSHPENLTDDAVLSDDFRARLTADLSAATLFVQGAKRSDMDDEAKKAFVGMAINTLATGYATLALGPYGPPVSVAVDPVTSPAAKALADLLIHPNDLDSEAYLDQVRVAFGETVKEVINKQVAALPPEQRNARESLSPRNIEEVGNIAMDAFTASVIGEIRKMVD